jgi:hypothetical protein
VEGKGFAYVLASKGAKLELTPKKVKLFLIIFVPCIFSFNYAVVILFLSQSYIAAERNICEILSWTNYGDTTAFVGFS